MSTFPSIIAWPIKLKVLGVAERLCLDKVDEWSARPKTWENNIAKYKAYAEVLRTMITEINAEALRRPGKCEVCGKASTCACGEMP